MIIDNTRCTGCMMCGDICKNNAIDYVNDGDGFWYPNINKKICIGCKACSSLCPLNIKQDDYIEKNIITYKAYSKDIKVREKSTSGGVFYHLAKNCIENNGYVVGCSFVNDYKDAMHIIVNNISNLDKIIGSKYFQSNTCGIYRKVKKLLDNNKKVLFSGTPCQIAALNCYLRKKYDNLTTVDFICRGINSPKAYHKYLDEIESKNKSFVNKVRFKDKKLGWTNLSTRVEMHNGKTIYKTKYNDPWVNAYVKGNLQMRLSCYNCEFKLNKKESDITLGDYWGIEYSKDEKRNGVSLIMLNTKKGINTFEAIKDLFVYKKSDINEIVKNNQALVSSPFLDTKKRSYFFNLLEKTNYSDAVWRTMKIGFIDKSKMLFKHLLVIISNRIQ